MRLAKTLWAQSLQDPERNQYNISMWCSRKSHNGLITFFIKFVLKQKNEAPIKLTKLVKN